MNVKRQLKKYYLSRIEVQKVPELNEILQRKVQMETSEERQRILVSNLVFHAGLIVFLALILAFNSNTPQSLQRLVKAYFRPNPVPVK